MVIASGNVVHNLRRVLWDRPDAAFDWAERFDDATAQLLAEAPGEILRMTEHPDYREAVPTPDHFIPHSILRHGERACLRSPRSFAAMHG